MNEFKCAQCDTWRPNSELGRVKSMRGYGQNRCKQCVSETKEGDTGMVSKATIKPESDGEWIKGQCEVQNCCNVDDVKFVGGKYRCPECCTEWDGIKDRCFAGNNDDRRPTFKDSQERLNHMTDFGEASDKNQALKGAV